MANDTTNRPTTGTSANRDPMTGAPGAHPVGTAAGAVAGGVAAGAAVGTVAGPVGTAIGAAVGAVVGGLAGKGIAEQIDPTREDAYWRDNYSSRVRTSSGASYDDYGPAYSYGVNSYSQYSGPRLRRRRVRPVARLGQCARQLQPGLGARQARHPRRLESRQRQRRARRAGRLRPRRQVIAVRDEEAPFGALFLAASAPAQRVSPALPLSVRTGSTWQRAIARTVPLPAASRRSRKARRHRAVHLRRPVHRGAWRRRDVDQLDTRSQQRLATQKIGAQAAGRRAAGQPAQGRRDGLERGHAPKPGQPVEPHDPIDAASTVTEDARVAPRSATASRRSGYNPGNEPLDRVRVDSGGQVLTTNQGVADRRQPELAEGRAARADAARGLHPPREDHPLRPRAHPRAHRARARLGGARLLRVLRAAAPSHARGAVRRGRQAHAGVRALLDRRRRARLDRHSRATCAASRSSSTPTKATGTSSATTSRCSSSRTR